MRVLLAILLSLLLVGPPYQVAAQAPAENADACVTCTCAQMECCPAPPMPSPQPVPAMPVRSESQSPSPSLPSVAQLAVAPPLSTASDFLPVQASPLKLAAPPLYERHCSYLI